MYGGEFPEVNILVIILDWVDLIEFLIEIIFIYLISLYLLSFAYVPGKSPGKCFACLDFREIISMKGRTSGVIEKRLELSLFQIKIFLREFF